MKRKRSSEPTEPRSLASKRKRNDDDDFGLEFSEDIKAMMKAELLQVNENMQKIYGQKNKEKAISSVYSDIEASIDKLKSKIEKKRQSFDKALSTSKEEFENLLNSVAAKFDALWEAHVNALQATISNYEKEKEKLLRQHEEQREQENIWIAEQQKECDNIIVELEESLKKEDGKLFRLLRNTVDSILKPESDDDFQEDDD